MLLSEQKDAILSTVLYRTMKLNTIHRGALRPID